FLEAVKLWAKTKWWTTMEYSDVEVKAKLGLSKLKGGALKAHPNFVWYQDYLREVEKEKLNLWLSNKKSPRVVFQEFGLNNLVRPQLSDKYQTYLRYATKYDDKVFSFPPFYPQTTMEKKIYVEIWANARTDAYVKKQENAGDKGRLSQRLRKRYFEEFKRQTIFFKLHVWGKRQRP
ncbi:hypothetical protein PHYSODRAFT_521139, partial [Phytophthora sojae]